MKNSFKKIEYFLNKKDLENFLNSNNDIEIICINLLYHLNKSGYDIIIDKWILVYEIGKE